MLPIERPLTPLYGLYDSPVTLSCSTLRAENVCECISKRTCTACEGRGITVLCKSINSTWQDSVFQVTSNATYGGVVNDPWRFQLLEGGMTAISHRNVSPMDLISKFIISRRQVSTFLFESNDHDVPITAVGLASNPLVPLPNLLVPAPRAATHLIPAAPLPKCNSTVRFSIALVVRREVRVMSKTPKEQNTSE
jgi:hypothetical protein